MGPVQTKYSVSRVLNTATKNLAGGIAASMCLTTLSALKGLQQHWRGRQHVSDDTVCIQRIAATLLQPGSRSLKMHPDQSSCSKFRLQLIGKFVMSVCLCKDRNSLGERFTSLKLVTYFRLLVSETRTEDWLSFKQLAAASVLYWPTKRHQRLCNC